mgnify:CR=1 FL=1
MLSFDFEYYRPDTIEEAIGIYKELERIKKQSLYFSGGTEVVSMARKGVLKFDALIDLKGIKEMKDYASNEEEIYFGANMTLNEVAEQDSFPLLKQVVETIADHTVRNRITLGGNICGRLGYREAVLPFLLVDAEVCIAGAEGVKTLAMEKAFDRRLKLSSGEFVTGFKVKSSGSSLGGISIRKVRTTDVDYPLLHIAAMEDEKGIKLAVSGLCPYPFRSKALEQYLNDIEGSDWDIKSIYELLPSQVKDDNIASSEYRKAVFEKSIEKLLRKRGEA